MEKIIEALREAKNVLTILEEATRKKQEENVELEKRIAKLEFELECERRI